MHAQMLIGRFLLVACLLAGPAARAQVTLASGYVLHPSDALGPDKPYDFSPVTLTSAPKGYEAVCIEHYGRHGSRYAYEAYFYQDPWNAFRKAEEQGLLTRLGQRIYADYQNHYAHYMQHVGELTDLGWEQQRRIAGQMHDNFPAVFRKDAGVTALASFSYRSILSMSSFCLALQARAPWLTIREKQGLAYLKDTHPRDKRNPDRLVLPERPAPFPESSADFQARMVNGKAILGRLFTDVDAVRGDMPLHTFINRFYILAAGMQSLAEEDRSCFDGLFTEAEFAGLTEWLNYVFYRAYYWQLLPTSPVSDGIVASADRRLQNGERGATLRFGHDHVLLPLLRLLGIDGQEKEAASPDEVSRHYHIWNSPMAGNVQFIFYRPKAGRAGRTLFKVLLNGRETRLAIPPVQGPYYDWENYKEWYKGRIASLQAQ